MENQIDDILGFLRHQKPEVKRQAAQAFMQLSADEESVKLLFREDIVKALMACLYERVIFFLLYSSTHLNSHLMG